jgi:hypothetical protein
MEQILYPMQWLDWAVTEMLGPVKMNRSYLTATFCQTMINDAGQQAEKQEQFLRRVCFELTGKAKSNFLRNYHNALVLLYDQSVRNQQFWQGDSEHIVSACCALRTCIETILSSDQINVHGLHPCKKIVSGILLESARRQLLEKLSEQIATMTGKLSDESPLMILRQSIAEALSHRAGHAVMQSDLSYYQDLVSTLTKMQPEAQPSVNQQNLHALLITFNFNNPEFMRFYINQISLQIDTQESAQHRLTELRFLYKEFCQIQLSAQRAFDGRYPDVKKVITGWFEQEIRFAMHYCKQLLGQRATLPEDGKPFKVLCFLSVDQIAIILRSMDALRIFQAKSLNAIIQSLAPYLSTAVKTDISWQSMRSKAYSLEENDRKIVISTLQSMIKWIEEF